MAIPTLTAAQKITKSKIQLLLSNPAQPFFASLMLGIKIIEDTSVNKSATDGTVIKMNPDYVDTLTIDEMKGHICTGVMETALLHHLRRNGRDAGTWSKACQLAANQIVKQAGLTLPKDALHDNRFKDLAAEEIFNVLQSEKQKEQPQNSPQTQPDPNGNQQGQQQGQGQPQPDNGPMEVQDSPAKTEAEKQQQEATIKQKVAQAAQIAKKAGRLPGFLQELIEDLLEAKINWKEVLARFIVDIARNDYSFSKPNVRFLHTGFILPSLYNVEPNDIYLLVDKSASMEVEVFKQIGGEIKDAASQINAGLTLMYIDTEVQGEPLLIESDDAIPFLVRPSGGTDFAPGFEYIEQNDLIPKAVIYLTDGDCDSFPEYEPDYPVLWIVYNNKHFKPPFGEVIEIDTE